MTAVYRFTMAAEEEHTATPHSGQRAISIFSGAWRSNCPSGGSDSGVKVLNMQVAVGSYGSAWGLTPGYARTIKPKPKKFRMLASAIRSGPQ
jgi:hypothetical protein